MVVGVAAIVFGAMFILQANDSQDVLAAEVVPLQLSQVDARYDQVKGALAAATDAAEIQNLTLQKTSLGLAKSNMGAISMVRTSGILYIVFGAAFVFTGALFFVKE